LTISELFTAMHFASNLQPVRHEHWKHLSTVTHLLQDCSKARNARGKRKQL